MQTLHLCQDDYGFWFVSWETEAGLVLAAHGMPLHDAADDAVKVAAPRGGGVIHVEPERREYPEGGHAPGYQPPEPRRARRE